MDVLQLGYVETQQTDVVRDSLIGAAPLFTGGLFVAYAAIYHLHLLTLWEVLRNGQFDLFWSGITLLPQVKDFYVWLYLTFTVSSTMIPSTSDRYGMDDAWAGCDAIAWPCTSSRRRSVDVDLSRAAIE